MRTALLRLCLPVPLLLLCACAGNGEGLDENGRPVDEGSDDGGPVTADFASIQDRVFTPICTACHAGAAAPLGLRLDEGASYAMLVGVASVQVPELLRVAPGNPDGSYLVHKIEGTAAVGSRMPLGGPPLSADAIAAIRQWIVDGAQPPAQQQRLDAPAAVRTTAPLPNRSAATTSALRVVLSRALDANSVHTASVELIGENAAVVPATARLSWYDPTVIVVEPAAGTPPGRYRLHLHGAGPAPLADLAGTPVDGDGDGHPGGDYILELELIP